jgi:drug/metabolite transporter (DMT)-like permease
VVVLILIYIKLLLTATFWGGTFIAGKVIAQSVHPVNAAFLRFTIAAICLLILVRKSEGRLPRLHSGQILPVILLGLTGVFAYNTLFFSGLKHIEAGRASLIIANNPIIISLLSVVIFKERLNWIKGMGICVSVAGAMVVISHGRIVDVAGYSVGMGELLIFGCVLSWVAYSLIGKVALESLSPLVAVAYSALVGAVLLTVPAFYCGIAEEICGYKILDWVSLTYLGFFGTVLGFFWYYQGIERIGPMRASVFINFVPISAIILSFFMLNESITPSLLVGGAMVIIGVYFTNASNLIFQLVTKGRI